jgi:hypothetical protein
LTLSANHRVWRGLFASPKMQINVLLGRPAVAVANDKLRAARQRTASLICSEDCLSRQELAELVNAWVWDHHHTVVEASANWVGQPALLLLRRRAGPGDRASPVALVGCAAGGHLPGSAASRAVLRRRRSVRDGRVHRLRSVRSRGSPPVFQSALTGSPRQSGRTCTPRGGEPWARCAGSARP